MRIVTLQKSKIAAANHDGKQRPRPPSSAHKRSTSAQRIDDEHSDVSSVVSVHKELGSGEKTAIYLIIYATVPILL